MMTIAETAAQHIADFGGAKPGYANDPAKLLACNLWVDHARPIIQVMFVLEDAADAPLLNAMLNLGKGRKFGDLVSWQSRDYEEATRYIRDAWQRLHDMLEGIRDNFIADERCGIGDTDDETQEADAFNDWLEEMTVSVDAAVQQEIG